MLIVMFVGEKNPTPPDELTVIPKAGKSFPWVDESHQRLQEMRKGLQATPAGNASRTRGPAAALPRSNALRQRLVAIERFSLIPVRTWLVWEGTKLTDWTKTASFS